VLYGAETDRYTPPDEHAPAFAEEDTPFYLPRVYKAIASPYADEQRPSILLQAATAYGGR
jgi:hypothetical protein